MDLWGWELLTGQAAYSAIATHPFDSITGMEVRTASVLSEHEANELLMARGFDVELVASLRSAPVVVARAFPKDGAVVAVGRGDTIREALSNLVEALGLP